MQEEWTIRLERDRRDTRWLTVMQFRPPISVTGRTKETNALTYFKDPTGLVRKAKGGKRRKPEEKQTPVSHWHRFTG